MHDSPLTSTKPDGASPSALDEREETTLSKGKARTRSLYKVTGSIGLSLAVLLGIGVFTFDPDAFWKILGEMRLWPFAVALLMTVTRVFFGGCRLRFISRGRLSLMEGMRGQLAWDFFSNVTPSAIGGGPIATLYVARDRGIEVGEATAFILFSILMDQLWFALTIPLVVIASFYVPVIPASLGTLGLWTFVAIFLGMLVWSTLFAYATLFRPSLLERLADRIFSLRYLGRFHARIMEEMRAFTQRAKTLRAQPFSFYTGGFLLTAGVWLGRYLLIVFIVWGVFPTLDKMLIFLRTVAMTLGSLVLPTPGGSGGLEGLYALFIGPLLPQALVAPTLFAWRALGYYLFIALGAYLFVHQMQQHMQTTRSDDPATSKRHTTARTPAASARPPEPEAAD